MKKIYIEPKSLVVKIETVHMIAESLDKNGSGSVDPSSGNVLSRQDKGNWDED